MGRIRPAAPFLVIALILALPALSGGALTPLNDLLALGQGGGQEPARAADRSGAPSRRSSPRRARTAGRARSPSPASRAACPRAPATDGLHCNVEPGRPPGHLGRLQGPPLRRRRRATSARSTTRRCCSRSTRSTLDGDARTASRCSTCPTRRSRCRPTTLTEPPMLSPHESLNLNAKRGLLAAVHRQPGDLPRAGLDLRRPQGLPPPGAAVDRAGRAPRPRERVLARTARPSTRPAPRTSRSPRST